MRNSIIPATYIVFIRDDSEILLQRRFNTGYQDGNYSLPAGHVERKETPLEAARREAQEETGVTIEQEDLPSTHIMYRIAPHQDADRICFFFRALKWQGIPQNMEPTKCDNMGWFTLDNLPENTIDYIRFAISEIRKGHPYSEWNKTI